MNKYLKITLLAAVLLLLALLTVRQILAINGSLHRVHFTKGKEHTLAAPHRWMSVSEIAEKHNLSPEDVFAALHITPEKGDENISLRALGKKYKMSPEVVRTKLEGLIKQTDSAGTKNE